ncbi:TPA-induced transmembrane protein [Dunckerocampus dactyliophorus]|uniref:TPA-induced transmembrane protein n=1 Tax=Dunckerocampus dactyliophorus TaxID=161453 RepID=UPI002405993B|nr:TPA-induced transmembrane protein [Dunckerocampus dactyliophorus]XP_054650797.1 TPA-induced transmembrane protein [Dunckerocampus dactyliophorus]XP_054650798.1 TPA-induced transmembrane protein [Dunckerocampus dactyliophorus]
MDIAMQTIKTNGSDAAAHLMTTTAGNGDGHAYRCPDTAETRGLLGAQHNGHNRETPSGRVAAYTSPQESAMCRVKKELSEVVFWKVQLWMAVVMLFILVVAVVLISLAVCAAVHEDADEKFDRSTFRVPRLFNGSFSLPGLVFSEDLLMGSSNESQALASVLQGKLTGLYRSSPALGRYFSKAEIYALRNGSVIAEYQLTFLMPEEHEEQLRSFTLSREMVYNVLRQFLCEQDDHASGPLYIDPVSLKLF